MRNLIFATSVAFAVITTATHAADFEPPVQTLGTSGYGEIFGLYMFDSEYKANADRPSDRQFEPEYVGLGGGGHVNFWLNDNYTLQIDGAASFFRNENSTGDNYRMFAVEALAHAGWRDPEQGYIGGFGGLLSYGYGGCSYDCSYDQFVIGGEGAIYLDMVTVFAQAGFMDSWTDDTDRKLQGDGNSFTDAWFIRGGVRYFANPNLQFEASGGLFQGNEYAYHYGKCCRVDMPFWKVEGEYKPDDSRVSWFASYGGFSENEMGNRGTNYSFINHTVMAGARIHFGQDTLLSFDRTGASLDFLDTRMLPVAYDH